MSAGSIGDAAFAAGDGDGDCNGDKGGGLLGSGVTCGDDDGGVCLPCFEIA